MGMADRPYIVSILTNRRERKRVLEWVRDEWKGYADERNQAQLRDVDKYMREEGCAPGTWWCDRVTFYLDRTRHYGISDPRGKQAVMKAVCTMIDLAATMIRVYGEPPKAGKPSGEV